GREPLAGDRGRVLEQREQAEPVECESGRLRRVRRALEVALRLVVRPAIGDQRLAECRARVDIVAVLDDRLAQLADRLVEIASPPPRDAEAAVRVREDPAIAAGIRDRASERADRDLVLALPDQREPEADQRGRIAGALLQRALERLLCAR